MIYDKFATFLACFDKSEESFFYLGFVEVLHIFVVNLEINVCSHMYTSCKQLKNSRCDILAVPKKALKQYSASQVFEYIK